MMRSKGVFLIILLIALCLKNSEAQVYSGGAYVSATSVSSGNCSPSFFNVVAGGSFDGASSIVSSACSPSSFNVVGGGSFDGASSVVSSACSPSAFNVVAGGSFVSASNVVSSNCSSSSFIVVAGGSNDGAAVNINSCNSFNIISIASVNATCSQCNGSASVTVSGGSAPYTYYWSSGGGTNSAAIGLCAGSYSVTVTDAASSATTSSIIISQAATLSAASSSGAITCNGGSATVNISASGGTGPYTGTGSFARSAGGPYSFTVTDVSGCTATTSVSITEPSAITISSSSSSIQCYGGQSTVTITASGGTGVITGTGSFTRSAGGPYSFAVTDGNGCTASTSVSITEPPALSVSASSNQPVCRTNNINLSSTASGGTGAYTYSWSGPNGYSSTDANNTFIATTTAYTGTYSFTVTDANNCTATTATFVEVNNCNTTLNLNLYIEGYYIGSSLMRSAMQNEFVCTGCGTLTDSIFIILHNPTSPYAMTDSIRTLVNTNGTATYDFPPALTGQSRYIEVRHRNSIQTWSASPVTFAVSNSYDFTSAPSAAYGNNLIKVDVPLDKWALYSGNLNQDQNIDLIDFPILDFGINNGLFGYHRSDLNGDGNTDLLDFPVLDANINTGVFSRHP